MLSLNRVVPTDLYVLIIIYKLGGLTSILDLVYSSKLDKTTIYYNLRRLENKGLVKLYEDKITITRYGIEVIESLKELLCG